MRTEQEPIKIEVPRDRNSKFEPRIIPKHQMEWWDFDDKILSMYGLYPLTKAIQENLKEIYNVDVSLELISRVTYEEKEYVEE